MKIGVLGTGGVGQTLATALVAHGHEVKMGSRQAGNVKAVAWAEGAGDSASEGSFRDAAAFADLVVNATAGAASLDALESAGTENLAGKVILDVSNPLDFSKGFPPSLTVCNTDSVAEQLQRAFPDARVVKSLNTMNCDVMVEPSLVPGSHNVFLAGNDDGAKAEIKALLEGFGWPSDDILDLGDATAARGMEMYVPFWVRLFGTAGTGHFNIKLVLGS
ncbi:MAG TPA: NAD(P)-binding domain-containing protein [Acidimicrobiales bacterium]|nr:NAD(P)-binding domain-containing protein [Acidimicrobiales bacterium]